MHGGAHAFVVVVWRYLGGGGRKTEMRFGNRRRATWALGVAVAALTARAFAAPIGTVFVIALENHDWTAPAGTTPQQLLGNSAAPYLNSLVTPGNPNAAQVSYASNYLNAAVGVHPSEPNYLWSEAGTNYNPSTGTTVLGDADPSAAAGNIFSNVPHLTGQMTAAGVSWKTYQEDYQISSNTVATGGSSLASKSGTSTTVLNPYYNTYQYNYAVKHNPMAFFTDTAGKNVSTFDQLRADMASDTRSGGNPNPSSNFAQYNWITPNQYNDMHSALSANFTYNGVTYTAGTDQQAIAQGDNFLSQIVPQLMATDAYKNNGVILIWTDETEGGGSVDDLNHRLAEIVISPLARGNAFASSVEMNHSSDIRTMEEIFQLGGYLNNPIPSSEPYEGLSSNTVAGANDLSSLFTSGAITALAPEPASLGAMGLAALGLLARRSRSTVMRRAPR
jgi:hypothetical protein